MDLAATDVQGNPQSDGVASTVGEKRPNENGDGGESMVPPPKKLRFGEEMKRVAEIVLVLSAMGRMRGGKSPTEVELELMAEARAKLADMCQEFTPMDIVGRDAIGAVIEDLGLNGKLKDQRLGFRAPKLTISEKLSLGKRKMEESKKYPALAAGYTSHLSQPSSGAAAPGLSTLGSATHTVRTLPSDRTNHQLASSGVFPASSPYVALAGNVSMAHQWPSNEVKVSTTSGTAVGSHYIRDASGLAQSRMERPQIKSDMLTSASQGPAISSANYPMGNAPTWSAQPQSTFSANLTADNKVHIQSSVRASDQGFRPFVSQTPSGTFLGTNQPIQGMNYGQTSPFGNNHTEIAKIIQKFLQPRVHQNPTWNPPSREYMNKPVTCQICQATVAEVETVLICDACDKGYHLKCLQANYLKGVPKSEWHCSRCVHLYNGKPFPPKYGRVMRSANTPKAPSNTAAVQFPPEKKVGMPDQKVNQQKTTVTASPVLHSSSGFGSERSKPPATVSDSETASANANPTARVSTNATLGSQGCMSRSSPPVPASHSETTNATVSATPSAMMNNGLVSKGPMTVGTRGATSELLLGNCVPSNAAANTIASAPVNCSLRSQGVTDSVTRDGNSPASGTANETAITMMDANLSTQGLAVTGTSNSDSQAAVSDYEAANATKDAAFSAKMVNASSGSQGFVGNGAGSDNSSELVPHVEALNTRRTPGNSQELGREVERAASLTYQDNPTRSLETHVCPSFNQSTVISYKDGKVTAESSLPQETSICQIEGPMSQPSALSSNPISNSDHLQPENKMPNVQAALQDDTESPREDKRVDILEERYTKYPSESRDDKPSMMKETTAGNSGALTEVQGIP